MPRLKTLLARVCFSLTIFLSPVAMSQQTAPNYAPNYSPQYQNSQPLRVGYIDFPPLYETVDDQVQGILADVSLAVFQNLNLNVKHIPMPTKRLFSSLKVGLIHIWCGIKVDQLRPKVWIGSETLHQLTLNLYSLTGEVGLREVTQLKAQGVILLMGYSYGGWGDYIRNKKNDVNYIEVKSHADALRLFNTGRYQYLLNYQAPMNAALASSPLSNLNFHTIDRLDIVFNVSKSVEQGKQMLVALEQSLAALKAQGLGTSH